MNNEVSVAIPWAYTAAGRKLTAETATPEAGPLTCGACRLPVILKRQGVDGRRRHFAHKIDGGGCGEETQAHRLLKAALADLLRTEGLKHSFFAHSPGGALLGPLEVRLEEALGDLGIKPDVTGFLGEPGSWQACIAFEVVISNPPSREKRLAYTRAGVTLVVLAADRHFFSLGPGANAETEAGQIAVARGWIAQGKLRLIAEPPRLFAVTAVEPALAAFRCRAEELAAADKQKAVEATERQEAAIRDRQAEAREARARHLAAQAETITRERATLDAARHARERRAEQATREQEAFAEGLLYRWADDIKTKLAEGWYRAPGVEVALIATNGRYVAWQDTQGRLKKLLGW